MNPNENQNDTTNQPVEAPLTQITPPQQPVPQPKKKSRTLPITVAFLAGAMTYAIFGAVYNLYIQSYQDDGNTKVESSQQTTAQEEPIGPSQDGSIDETDLDKYVEATDCTTKPAYAAYQQLFELGIVASINLYDGMKVAVSTGASSRTYTVTWEELPKVVDYKCDNIEITEIANGDRVNIYIDKGAAPTNSLVENTRVIQKATK